MPYGEKSAYEAQAKLKGQSPAYMKSSGFKMKGSPYKFNGGTGSVIGAATMAGNFKPRTRPPVNRPPGNPLGPQRGSGRTTLSNRARGF